MDPVGTPRTHILILNYNGRALLEECLPSVVAASRNSPIACGVTVVDNGSTDESLAYLTQDWPEVGILCEPNRGLASFNSVLGRMSEPVVLLLNNDVKLDQAAVGPLVAAIDRHPDALFAAPQCWSFDGSEYEGMRTRVRSRFGLVQGMSRVPGHEAWVDRADLTAAAGPILAVNREKFLELGGYDPLYFPGRIEDLDLGFRGWMAALRGYYVPESIAYHRGFGSFAPAFGRVGCDLLAIRNTLLFCWKNLGGFRLASHLAWLPIRLVHSVICGRTVFASAFLQALARLASVPRSPPGPGRGHGPIGTPGRKRFSDGFAGKHATHRRTDDTQVQGGTAMTRNVVIDARPRGPRGPMAGERVLGRAVLAHLVDLARELGDGPVCVYARLDEHPAMRRLVDGDRVEFATGSPPESAPVLRADRLYDRSRLHRALKRGRDPEIAVIWRLDRPMALESADAELSRRRTYQPLGRFWSLAPARTLARLLVPTKVRPNAVTTASFALMMTSATLVAFAPATILIRLAIAAGLAVALVFDTADGHLARLQGTASEFGRWLDAVLDEAADLALHAAVAWALYSHSGNVGWLMLGWVYAGGKYLFVIAQAVAAPAMSGNAAGGPTAEVSRLTSLVRLLGHADIRWHLWIALAALGRLDLALIAYAAYFPLRTVAIGARKAVRRG